MINGDLVTVFEILRATFHESEVVIPNKQLRRELEEQGVGDGLLGEAIGILQSRGELVMSESNWTLDGKHDNLVEGWKWQMK